MKRDLRALATAGVLLTAVSAGETAFAPKAGGHLTNVQS
jgi:hypothetical protein